MQFICFGSGSSGNCYFLRHKHTGILIDLGIPLRTLKRYFYDYGLSFQAHVNALILTHDHIDHVKSAARFSSDFNLPVYGLKAVHEGMLNNPKLRQKISASLRQDVIYNTPFTIGDFTLTPFLVPHDASANAGFLIETDEKNFVHITDAGHITPEMNTFIAKADNLAIEANYDMAMLATGPYPLRLKQRIDSETGHCSNTETAKTLAAHLPQTTKHVFLCHLSQENNHPDIARQTVQRALDEVQHPAEVHVLPRRSPSRLFDFSK